MFTGHYVLLCFYFFCYLARLATIKIYIYTHTHTYHRAGIYQFLNNHCPLLLLETANVTFEEHKKHVVTTLATAFIKFFVSCITLSTYQQITSTTTCIAVTCLTDCGVRGPRFKSHRGQLHVYRKNHCDIHPWARFAHTYCSA